MDNNVTCARCGQVLRGKLGIARHKDLCDRLPTPEELIKEYRESGLSTRVLSRSYGVDVDTLRQRMELCDEYQNAVVCARCGKKLSNHKGYMRHKMYCNQLPTPDELVDEWQRDGVSLEVMAERYGTNRNVIRPRMQRSEFYKPALKAKRQEAAIALKPYSQPKKPTCKCGLLLSHEMAQPAVDGMCKWCYLERHGLSFRVMFPAPEYTVDVVEYA